MRRRSRIKLALLFVLLATLGALLWQPIRQTMAIAGVQNALQRNYEINFGDGHRPSLLPKFLDKGSEKVLEYLFEETQGDTNRDIIHHERVRGLFRGPIESIQIFYPEGMPGDLGAALVRFPQLRRLEIRDLINETESDWKRLFARFRDVPRLEEVDLGGSSLTDAALVNLAENPKLKRVTLTRGNYTPACLKTFATLPNLTHLTLDDDDSTFPENERDSIRAALPKVIVEFK